MNARLNPHAAELVPQYLVRIVQQQEALHRYVHRIDHDDFHCLADIFETTLRVAVDAPVFGFNAIGKAARNLNLLIASFEASPSRWDIARLESLLIEFDDAVYKAASPRKRTPGRGKKALATGVRAH